jgi:3',5'-cyclic AMP phosphodiesterase CpdA
MEIVKCNYLKVIIILFVITGFACKKFQMKGFVTTYEGVNSRFEKSIAFNQIHGYSEIQLLQSNYTIFAMGDSHVGGTVNLDILMETAVKEKVAAVVMAGDLTTGNKEDFDEFFKHMPSKDSLNYFPILGNHDLYFDGWKSFQALFGTSSYFFVVKTPAGNDLYICLDTGGGTLGDKQLAWLKKLLESDRKNYRYCSIFTHNNIFRLRPTTSTNPMVEENHVLTDLFVRHNVNLVVTAHDHKRNTDVLGKTTHIIMDALLDNYKNASYLKLMVNENKIDFSFVEI